MSYTGTTEPTTPTKYVRANVYANGGDFSDPTILWYARGVAAMKSRAIAEPLSWGFYGAIHGIYEPLWRLYGYLSNSDPLPPQDQQELYWNQCQHGSWYFLPWHRGYLLAFEATVRAAVISLGGPSDWALPYWNYFGANENALPPAFATPDWPDGTGNNPLYVPQRWGPNDDGNVYVPLDQVNLDALTDPDFTGVASGGDPGFGGVDTGYEHGGPVHGRLESQPHDMVHVLVGGSNPQNRRLPGLMSDPDTAGLDPIFWLHHANIDRLWEVWLQGGISQGNPTDPNWVNGPASIGEHPFVMPMPPGGTEWIYTPGEMSDLAQLDYTYDDLSAAAPGTAVADRLAAVQPPVAAAADLGGGAVASRKDVELVGANEKPLRISGRDHVRASVQFDPAATQNLAASLNAAADIGSPTAPDRVFLNLENIRGLADATAFQVYINLPEGADPASHPERLAGTVALFGVRKATAADQGHGGAGLTFVLEITHIVNALHLDEHALDAGALDVRIVPIKDVPEDAEVSVGRVSVFRQSQ